MLLASPAEAALRYVVLLQSSERGNLVLDRFTAMLRMQLGEYSAEPLRLAEFVVTPAGFNDFPEQTMVEFLRSATAGEPRPDLVITTGGAAAAFVQRHRAQLFPDSPILYASLDQRWGTALTDRETAVAVALDPTGSVAEIVRLLPATENVFVVVGGGALGRFWRSVLDQESSKFRDRLRFIWPDGMSYAAMLQQASTLPARSVIFFTSTFEVDANGATYSVERVLADLRARANAPIFGMLSPELGHGTIGGRLIDIDALSRTTADVAFRILDGTVPAHIKTPTQQPGAPVFDWRELQRWGISEDRLPAGSVVLFREQGVWARYRWAIVGSVAALVAQSLLITGLLVSRVKRRRAEQSLRESEGRFRVLANSAPVMIRMSDVDTLAIDFNVPWRDFTGRDLAAERGNGWMEGVHPDDVSTVSETMRRAFERREPYRMEYRLRRADGEYRWLLDSGQPRMTPDGAFAGTIGSAIDITDLKAARATLSSLNRRLIEAQEQERSRLARELHDDVGQQMTMLALDVDRLGENIPETEADARQQARNLRDEVTALASHVSGISHRLHSSKLDLLGLAAAAGTFCKEVSSRSGVIVEFTHENVPATLSPDIAINLFRVLQEALSNAVKHSSASRFDVSLRGTNDQLQLAVRDEGQGFDTSAARATSGLGLVSMQERLKLVNGCVAIESSPGAGTTVRATVPLPRVREFQGTNEDLSKLNVALDAAHRTSETARSYGDTIIPSVCDREFVVSLPISAADERHEGESPHLVNTSAPSVTVRARRVMIVDDHEEIRASVTRLLRGLGHEVVVAADGATALSLVEAFQPECAIVDLSMPGMDGFALGRRLRQRFPPAQLCLIALSGYAGADMRDACLAEGFDAYLVKPEDIRELERLLGGDGADSGASPR